MSYVDALLEAIAASRRSGRDISISAVGHAGAVRDLKRRRDLRASTLEALCRELGVEFYIGPPRSVSPEIARALGLPETCSTQDALLAINQLIRSRVVAIDASPVEIAEEIASGIKAQRRETRDGFARIEQLISNSPVKRAEDSVAEGGADPGRLADEQVEDLIRKFNEVVSAAHDAVTDEWIFASNPDSFFEDFEGDSTGVFVRRRALSRSANPNALWIIDPATFVMEYVEPTVRDGEIVIVDVSQYEPTDGQLFVAPARDALAVCVLRREADTWLACSNDRSVIPWAAIREECMIGRAAWHGPRDSSDLRWGSSEAPKPDESKSTGRVIEFARAVQRRFATG